MPLPAFPVQKHQRRLLKHSLSHLGYIEPLYDSIMYLNISSRHFKVICFSYFSLKYVWHFIQIICRRLE